LSFVERNPGFGRLFVGDALQGETERLRVRMHQLLNRIETQLRLVLREHNTRQPTMPTIQINASANMLLAYTEGRIIQFVRSNFSDVPTKDWEEQWRLLGGSLFGN
jgi:TetR/AcrR family transcriptional regulator